MTRRAFLRGTGVGGVLAAGWRLDAHASMTDWATTTPPAPAAPGAAIPTPRIDLSPDRHVPPELHVPAGTTVAWLNRGHDWIGIAALDGSFESGPIAPGKVFAHRFTRRGSVTYVCENHPIRNMTGRIEVR